MAACVEYLVFRIMTTETKLRQSTNIARPENVHILKPRQVDRFCSSFTMTPPAST